MKFDLIKAAEKAKFTLQKKGIPNVKAQVITALDVSGSAQGLFTSGKMQKAWQTIMGVASNVDLNQEIDVYTFANADNVAHVDPTATVNNFENYIEKNILNNRSIPKWGGTDYAEVIKQALDDFGFYESKKSGGFMGGMFGKKTEKQLTTNSKSGDPVICYFLTDGENYDKSETETLLHEMEEAGTQFYILFVGIGNVQFKFIDKMGEKFSNVGFVAANDLNKFAESESIYDELLPDELVEWLAKK